VPQLSDRINVGEFAGNTTVDFTVTNPGMLQLQSQDIVVIHATSDVVADNATATGLPAPGLIAYQFHKVGNDWVVSSAGNPAVLGGIAANIAIVQSTIGAIVNRPSSPFVSGLAADVPPTYCGPGVWGRTTAGAVQATGTTSAPPTFTGNAKVSMVYAGAQFGIDLACFNIKESGIDVAIGAIGGTNAGASSQPVAGLGTTTASFQQGYLGAYATLGKGNFSADVQARADFTGYTFNNPSIMLNNAGLSTTRYTLSGSASYAIPVKDLNIVPTAGFSASHTTASSLTFTPGRTLTPDPSNSLVGFVGATLAKTIILPDQVSAVTPFATATVYQEFIANSTATFSDAGATQTITSSNLGTIGEVSLGLNYVKVMEGNGPKQINATIRADGRFSGNLLGGGITAQIRAQF
jgi:hypothetical protein